MELAKGDTMRTTMPRRALRAPLACALALAACGGLGIGATIGGTLTGLASGGTLVLANNGKDNLALTSNGSFTFATQLDTGAAFGVTIVTQPTGQTCSVANGSGTVGTAGDVTAITVNCGAGSISGTVTGLPAGTSMTLSDGTTTLPIAVNGAFAFPEVLAVGAAYAVTVVVQPAGHHCTLPANAASNVPASGVVALTVTCI
jgi:AICAR transformylase/IMP cyclohydrolase PurH